MTLYTRHQLLLVLLLASAAGAGLAIDHWRHARPELAARLETLDRVAPPAVETARFRRAVLHEPAGARRVLEGAGPGPSIDVNRASEAELATLPGIGPALASRIAAARPFGDIDELRRVRGLRRTTLDRLRPRVTTGPAPGVE
jgi:DNA uptake protein ComE-like DNA-binding protein